MLADGVRVDADAVAEEVTDEFLRVHPDWLHRYGARARAMGIEDARYHITFLAAAVESGAPTAFPSMHAGPRGSSRLAASHLSF